jgi:beta-lactamase regulating signal transducer with metallopeptidase domain
MQALLGSPLAQAIGWALVHLVWQGAVVAGILAAVLALLQRRSAHVRYLVSCAAMLVLLGLATATAYRAYDGGGSADAAPAAASMTVAADVVDANGAAAPATLLARTRAWLPQIVLFWLAGVAALSVRLAGGWLRARRLARRNASPAADEWQQTVARLARALGIDRTIELLHSAAVDVPTVLGWMRPVILLPMTLSGLSPEQIEMILAHELAHIRRHDFLVNLMQSVVETLLFYHPAVWWISARIRIEREHCCDDAAVAVGGNALQYARALTRLEELRGATPQLALGANGGSLLERIRRVAGIRGEGTPSRWLAGAALLTVVAVLLVAPSLPMLARDHQAVPPAPAAPPAPSAAPAPAAPPAPAMSRIEVRADDDADDDDADVDDDDMDVNIEAPDPPEAPEPPEIGTPAPPRAPRAPRAPHAKIMSPNCPDGISVHVPPITIPKVRVAPMAIAMPQVHIEPMDIQLEGIDAAVRAGVEGAAIARRTLEPSQKYKDSMRGAGIKADDHEMRQMYVLGISARYVQSLREAGLRKLTAHDLIQLRARGITANFVKELQRMQQ